MLILETFCDMYFRVNSLNCKFIVPRTVAIRETYLYLFNLKFWNDNLYVVTRMFRGELLTLLYQLRGCELLILWSAAHFGLSFSSYSVNLQPYFPISSTPIFWCAFLIFECRTFPGVGVGRERNSSNSVTNIKPLTTYVETSLKCWIFLSL